MSTSVEELKEIEELNEKEKIEKQNAALAFCEMQYSLSKEKRSAETLEKIFFEAIEQYWDDVCKYLIKKNMIFINAISPRTGELALMFAASKKNFYTVGLLLEKENLQKEMQVDSGNTLIFVDLEKTKTDSEVFQVMMDQFMQHTSLTTLYISWQTPELIKAVKSMVKILKTHNILHHVVLVNLTNEDWDLELTELMLELSQLLKSNHINKTQKNMFEDKMKFYLGTIADAFAGKPSMAIIALEAVKATVVDKETVEQLCDDPIWNTIKYLREIVREQQDIVLKLILKNEGLDKMRLTAPAITRSAMLKELHRWVDVEILKQQEKLASIVEAQQAVTNNAQENDENDNDDRNSTNKMKKN